MNPNHKGVPIHYFVDGEALKTRDAIMLFTVNL